MLFLVTGEMKQLPPVPPQQFLETAIQEWENVINYQKQGKVLAQGMFAGRKGGDLNRHNCLTGSIND